MERHDSREINSQNRLSILQIESTSRDHLEIQINWKIRKAGGKWKKANASGESRFTMLLRFYLLWHAFLQGLVRNASVSGNLDAPEGGFDAIMQAIVCRNQIGWREKARRLLVFSTDAGFHYAGDGKLGGIVKPNDGLCHLDTKGTYTHSSLQDYPSISQINLKVKQNAINIIWAVTEEQINVYKRLTKHVEGSFAGKLSDDSSNVVELIREQYDAISSSVEMKDTASSAIRVKYFSSCLGTGPAIETSKCDRLKVGTKVDFIAEIEVTRCPANRSEWKQKFDIYPVRPLFLFFFIFYFFFYTQTTQIESHIVESIRFPFSILYSFFSSFLTFFLFFNLFNMLFHLSVRRACFPLFLLGGYQRDSHSKSGDAVRLRMRARGPYVRGKVGRVQWRGHAQMRRVRVLWRFLWQTLRVQSASRTHRFRQALPIMPAGQYLPRRLFWSWYMRLWSMPLWETRKSRGGDIRTFLRMR